MTDQAIEQEIQDKGLTAPRVTPDMIEATIKSEHYFTAAEGCLGNSIAMDRELEADLLRAAAQEWFYRHR
jgi:hypothetical protein